VLNVAIAHGLPNANKIVKCKSGKDQLHFIEIMACPGVVLAAGSPIPTSMEIRQNRINAIYAEDETCLSGNHMKP
jgi:iron only hydrogenase large subunit-like protein